MPNVLNEFAGDGVTQTFNFSMTGGYLSRDYVYFFTRPNDDLLNYTPYNDDDVTWLTDFSVRTANPIPVGTTFVILRSTTLDPLVDFQNTSRITEKNLDTATWQAVHIAAETSDTVGRIQVVATNAKEESATAVTLAQEAADNAAASADSAQQAGASAASALAASQVAQQEAIAAALSADQAVTTAARAESTAIAANATAQSAFSSAATATTTANAAATAATNATTTANNAVSVANSANATANAANDSAAAAVGTANSAAASAAAAVVTANEAKDLVDQAVSGAVVSFNGRAGIVTPQAGDYTKAQVGLGNVDNTADVDKPVSTAQSNAIGIKADKSYVDSQLNTKADKDLTNAALAQKADQSYVTSALSANATDDRNRANHTGTQTIATVTGLQSALDSKLPSSGGVLSGNLTVPSLNGGQLGGMRNKIINGNMEIAQRGVNFPAAAANAYYLDRWVYGTSTGVVATISKQADVPSSNEFQSSLRYTVTTSAASTSASASTFIVQHVEGYNARDLIGRAFTLSFWVRSSKTGVHCIALNNTAQDRSYVAEYTVNAANTWEFKTITVSGGLITAGTWDWINGIGLRVRFILAAGTNFRTAAGAWQTGTFLSTANQVNCLDTVGNIFAITGVQLEVGEVATPFEHRPYGLELSLCQRYYEVITDGILSGGYYTAPGNYIRTAYITFSAVKRATPTAKIIDYWTGSVVITLRYGGGTSTDQEVNAGVNASTRGVIGVVAGVALPAGGIVYNNFIADAEL